MKLLPLPNVDDDFKLHCLIRRGPLATAVGIQEAQAMVRDSYASYMLARGNPCSSDAPQVVATVGFLQNALSNRYDNSHGDPDLAYIKDIRESSPNICPMCGSPGARSIDHIFPQSVFPEFAIFSRNLVPACWDCNNHRRTQYRGLYPTDRVLHPYFDTEIQDRRLVRATIEPVMNSYRAPVLALEPSIPATDSLYGVVQFHINHVILKSGVLGSMRGWWPQLQRQPEVFFRVLPDGFSDADFDSALHNALTTFRTEFGTHNNWKSMLFAGLDHNPAAKAWVMRTIRQLRAGVIHWSEI